MILTNQGSVALETDHKALKSDKRPKSLPTFKAKVASVFDQLDIPIALFAATSRDQYRKPRTGMWNEVLEDFDLDVQDGPDLEACFFIGDAGGRPARTTNKADHSCSDRWLNGRNLIDWSTLTESQEFRGKRGYSISYTRRVLSTRVTASLYERF